MKVSAIIAAKNEEPSIGRVIKRCLPFVDEVIVVDANSEDATVKISEEAGARVIQETKKELNSLLNNYIDREKVLNEKISELRQENQRLPEKALKMVRLQREVDLQASLYSQLKEKYQETLIQESSKVQEVSIVKPAVAPSQPYNIPSKLMIITTGIVVGLIMGLVFAFLIEVFDTSMGTIEDVEDLLQFPVLGVIPHLQGMWSQL